MSRLMQEKWKISTDELYVEKQFPTFCDTSAALEFQETNSDEFKRYLEVCIENSSE